MSGLGPVTPPVVDAPKKPPAPPVPAISATDQRRLNDATADFEAMFIQQMLKSMRKTVPEDPNGGLFAKSHGEKIFTEMLDGEYARNFSRGRSGLGLKEAIFKQTLSNQLAQTGKKGQVPPVAAQNGVDHLRGGENSLNALSQSPIGKEMGVGSGVREQPAGKPPRVGIAAAAYRE